MQGHIVLKPAANVSLTVSTTAVALATPPTDVIGGILTVESADVRTKWDGANPVAGVGGGMRMAQNSVWEITGRDIFVALKFIRDGGTDAIVSVSYLTGG